VLSAEATNTNVMVFGLQTVEDVDLESAIQLIPVIPMSRQPRENYLDYSEFTT
jgi:hypothetical protein